MAWEWLSQLSGQTCLKIRSEARVGGILQQDSLSQAGEQGCKGDSGGPGVEPRAQEECYLSTVRKQQES